MTLVSGVINVVRIVLYFKHVHYDFFETDGHGSPALRATYLQNISSLTLLAHVQQKLDLQQIGWKMSNISKRILAPEIMSSNGIIYRYLRLSAHAWWTFQGIDYKWPLVQFRVTWVRYGVSTLFGWQKQNCEVCSLGLFLFTLVQNHMFLSGGVTSRKDIVCWSAFSLETRDIKKVLHLIRSHFLRPFSQIII